MRTGYAVVSNTLLLYSESDDTKKIARKTRLILRHYLQHVRMLIDRYHPTVIIIEEASFFSMAHAGVAMCLARLSAIPYLAAGTIPVYRINVSTWRSRVLGNGRATKADGMAYVLAKYGKTVNDDESDAICIGLAWYVAKDKLIGE